MQHLSLCQIFRGGKVKNMRAFHMEFSAKLSNGRTKQSQEVNGEGKVRDFLLWLHTNTPS